jgi:peroxiredoxin
VDPERLADITLPDADGADVRLGDLWADEPVVLIFLRHYG